MLRPDGLLPLTSGAYKARGLISDAQRAINLYQEINEEQETNAPQAMANYPRPGLKPLVSPIGAPGRGVFKLSNGNLYCVCGPNVYAVNKYWQATKIGQIAAASNPVSMSDNGTSALLVDASPNNYTFDLGTNAFSQYVDPTGSLIGATRVDFADTFFAANSPVGSNEWITSLSNQVAFNALVNGAKSSYPDPIQTLAFNLRQMWLIGSQTSEVWYLSGGSTQETFPYSEWPNIFVPYGTAAPYSLCQADVDLFWVSRNKQGESIIVKTQGYGVIAISTRAIEYQLSTYPTVTDCVAYTYQQAGHTFIVFHFPSANKAWAYDLSSQQWHERCWTDQNGNLNRERVAFCAPAYDAVVGQDWQTGQLYELDLQTFTDNAAPISCIRSFPHAVADLKEITFSAFVADLAAGGLPDTGEINQNGQEPPTIYMRYSNDGGGTWSNKRGKTLLGSGNYRSMQRWRGLGMARDRVYELSWSAPMLVTLQGAYLDTIRHGA